MNDNLLDQLDDDLSHAKGSGDDGIYSDPNSLSGDEIEGLLDDHKIPEEQQDSMARLDQLIDQEKPNKKSSKQKILLFIIILGAVITLLSVLYLAFKPTANAQKKALRTSRLAATGAPQQPDQTPSYLKRAKQKQSKQKQSQPSIGSHATIVTPVVEPSKSSQPELTGRQVISEDALQRALDFDPPQAKNIEKSKQLAKIKAINQQLNQELRKKSQQIQQQQERLEAYEKALKKATDEVAISGRTRIGGLRIIDFAATGKVAVVVSRYSTANSVIALTEGELLKLGRSSYKIEKVNPLDKRVLVGKYYYIDQKMVSQPILGIAKTPKSPAIKAVAHIKRNSKKLKPIVSWSILFASQSGDYSVIASKDNRAKRLSRGDRLSPYGVVRNILRDGSIVFKHHIIQYQSTKNRRTK